MLEPLIEKIQQRRPHGASPMTDTVGSKVTGAQTGALLAFLATKVLGQYELFPPYGVDPTDKPGRLLLVAPNIVAAERELGVDPRDFRLWVCLHEETHRVQFSAVPWLRDHLMDEIGAFVAATDVDPAALAARLKAAAAAAYGAVRDGFDPDAEDGGSLVEAVQTPAQREILDRITALMSLLEGHADVVMDGVGPPVVPTVEHDPRPVPAPAPRGGQVEQRHAPAARRGREAAPVPRRRSASSAASSTRVGMDGFNRVWARRRTCRPATRSPTRRPGCDRVLPPRELPA